MTTRHLIDPELLTTLATFPPMELVADGLRATRARIEQVATAAPIPADLEVDVERRYVSGPDGNKIGVLVYTPRNAAAQHPAVLYLHGGGFVMGSASMADSGNRVIACDLGCTIVSVDYRLAPETPYPGPVEDCYVALKWLHSNVAALGVDPLRIAISGRSGGGGLAASLALLARDREEVPLIFQHLISPMLDDRTCTVTDPHPCTGEFLWTRLHNYFSWRSLLGHEPGREGVSPYAAAARAPNLAGLPPTFISVGALDLFLDENMEFVRRLSRAGVPTELHIYPGAFHGFDMAPMAQIAIAARRNAFDALRRALYPTAETEVASQI